MALLHHLYICFLPHQAWLLLVQDVVADVDTLFDVVHGYMLYIGQGQLARNMTCIYCGLEHFCVLNGYAELDYVLLIF